MAAGKAVTAAAWAKAEKQYPDRSIPLRDIADLVGLAPIQLSQEAKRRGWPLRTTPRLPAGSTKESRKAQSKTLPAGSTEESRKAPTKNPQSRNPTLLVQRVYNTIDGELTKLEQQTGVSSQDRERASRALAQMVNSLEKAVEMQREMTKATAKGSGTKNKEALAHAEDLRRAIAERLERLQRQRPLGKRSGGAE